jgi:hypothetical protein
MSALLQTWLVSGSAHDAHYWTFISTNASTDKGINS